MSITWVLMGWRVEECIATLLSHSNWPKVTEREGDRAHSTYK